MPDEPDDYKPDEDADRGFDDAEDSEPDFPEEEPEGGLSEPKGFDDGSAPA